VRRTTIAIGSALLLGASIVTLVFAGRSPAFSAQGFAETLSACATGQEGPKAAACVRASAAALPSDAPLGEVVASTASVFAKSSTALCHDMMHALGQTVSSRITGDPGLTIGQNWSLCGNGFLHGVFEYLELPERDPDVTAFDFCGRPEFVGRSDLLGNCWHALGHSLYRFFDGLAEPAAGACVSGSKSSKSAWPQSACLSGVYMSDYDLRFSPNRKLAPDESVVSLLDHCREATGPQLCASFFSFSARVGEEQVRDQLEFCSSLGQDTGLCLSRAALAMTFARLTAAAGGGGSVDPSICLDGVSSVEGWEAGSGQVEDFCTRGALEAARTHGLAGQELDAALCLLMPVSSCTLTG
jgi:hypothetical protein